MQENDNLKKLSELTEHLTIRDLGMRKREQLFRKISKNIKDVIILLDTDGKIKYISPSISELTGWSVDNMIDSSLQNYLDNTESRESLVYKHVVDQHDITSIHRISKSDGSWIWFETCSYPIMDGDKISEVVCLSRDLTKRLNILKSINPEDLK